MGDASREVGIDLVAMRSDWTVDSMKDYSHSTEKRGKMNPNDKGPSVAVVGCGIGGLVLAAALLRSGVRVKVFEQASHFARIGTGIGLAPNAMKVLRRLGLERELESLAFEAEYRSSRRWDTGEELFRYPVKAEMRSRYGAPYLLLHRGDVHQALYELLPPGVVDFGSRLVEVSSTSDGVILSFSDGRREAADYVVGADGVHSVLRESLFTSGDARFTGRVAYRAVFPIELLRQPLMDPNTKWWGPDRHIVIYYISSGKEVYFTTSVPDDGFAVESFSAKGDLDELHAAFDGFHPAVQAVLDACPSVQKWAIFERDPLPTWQNGRVVLLGDACHPMTPYMQQGAATAMEDAVVLARCIREHDDVEAAFRRYESCRRPRTNIIQAESSKNAWNRTNVGSASVGSDFVWGYDAWETTLDTQEMTPQVSNRVDAGATWGVTG